jgi:hypothetical protein
MQTLAKTGLLALLTAFAVAPNADAQTYEEYEADQDASTKKSKKRPEVREIVKGTYAKTNVGAGMYLGQYATWVKPGTSIALAIGQDFMDQQNLSMAWEVAFFQGINNGATYIEQGQAGCYETGSCIQGDLRTYTFLGLYEASFYPTRRIGIGLRAGGGVLFSPLLMDEKYYQEEVVATDWKGNRPPVHDEMHPAFVGGPTLEYYTKLSHFSMGVDTDILYAVGFDLTASVTATLKYTF